MYDLIKSSFTPTSFLECSKAEKLPSNINDFHGGTLRDNFGCECELSVDWTRTSKLILEDVSTVEGNRHQN